jgi:hypothetical protein
MGYWKSIFILLVLFLSLTASGQQETVHTWSGACKICQSSIINPGWYPDGSGLFLEEMETDILAVTAGVSITGNNFEVAFGTRLFSSGSVLTNPMEDVTLETDSSPHMILIPLENPDSRISKDDVGVQKQFHNKTISITSSDESGSGYLFFPVDFDASKVTVVVHLNGEVFRFPFTKIPTIRGKFGNPEYVSTQTASGIDSNCKTTINTHSVPTDRLCPPAISNAETSKSQLVEGVSAIPRMCTKNISIAVAENGQIVSLVPQFAAKWIKNNQKKYPGLCFSQIPNPQSMNFVLVFSTSQSSFYGIFPTVNTYTNTSTSPISGNGTVTSSYGSTWNFTYEGTATTTTTTMYHENLPYTDTDRTLYVNAYSQNGALISQRWRTTSTREGGDAYNTLGYNLGSALGAIHIKERLLRDAVDDVAK